ncbi:MORN repeat-containing protein [Leishmania donovani]|uniref:MORN_repeat/FYVE_zinc_finger_containing_protein_p utative/Pfam:PF02493/Pfam:PF01363 n=1 Tax=Leishmania donovani TaxID=5661 RepID=A0A6J8FHB3_LEIDO|nr:MORN repeat-containing protein [Leishmania donovani]VDZ45593.1 MORN_repeat/FYVE_zinc_finger_containing_protein_putative/Pfam:PF02493/Pfam:PF01363 [Leishmania donovani]
MAHAAGGNNTADAAPQYYDPNAPLTRPVTTFQVETFVPREGMTPSLVLADGSHYFGPVVEDSRCRIPCGCGIILFQYDGAVKPNLTVAEAAAAASDSGGGGGLASFFFGRGMPQGGGASQAAATLTALCKRYRQGDRYGGDWVNGTFHGNGVLVTSSFTYHGTWIEGEMQGKGTISYTRKYVDYRPRNTNGSDSGVGEGVSNLLLKGLSYVSPFELVGTAAAPKEYIGDFDAKHYRHGMGLMRYYNGDVYEGEWRDNCRHGRGKLRKIDGEVYDGDWAFDQRHGNGKIMYPNGSLFKGSMEYDQRNGEGIMRFANGDEFFGTFKKDRIDGHGTMRYRNGDVYEGSWRDQLRHGQGKYTLKRTGATMHGEFQSGLIHGEGTVIVPGVSTFVGMFVRGERTIGTMHWHQQSSQQLQAELVNDDATTAAAATAAATLESPESSLLDTTLLPGPATPPPPGTGSASVTATIGTAIVAGKASTTNYLCYQGQWHGEHMHGRGLLWYTNGDFYAGDFHKSRRHGAGNMRYAAEQAEFSGQYVHGIRHGLGLLQRANKTIQAGRWQQNIFVEGYEGEWDGSVFHGIGRLTMPVDIFLAMRSSSSTLKPSELSAMWNGRSSTLSTNASFIAGHEEGRRAAGDGAPQGAATDTSVSGATANRADLSPLFIDFFGLFRNGLRDGLGVLKLPALNGLVGGSLNLAEERKSGGGGGQCDSGGGGTTTHGAGGVKAERGRRGSGGVGDGNAAAGAPRSRYNTVSLASMPSMLIKGRWVRDVLHCDKGVWAFPNGVVYIGRFRNGARDATRACVWWPDGSVLESGWCGDAPSGAGIWYQRNRITPVYQTISPSVLRRSQSLRLPEKGSPSRSIGHATDGGQGTSDAADADGNSTSVALARDPFGMSYLLRLIGSGLIGHGTSSVGDGGGGDTHDESDNDQPRRVLVDFGNHFTFSCSWCPYTMDLSTYAAVVLPQIGSQTSPLPGGTPWPQLYHSPSMSAAVGAPRPWAAETAKGGRGAPQSTAAASPTTAVGSSGAGLQASVPWPVPTAKKMSSCANSLHLSEAPSSVVIGRASGAGVVYFDSGVVLAGEWLGNVPRLATPYRPWSAFDHFITWQTARAASRNCVSTVPRPIAPRLQSCYTSVLVAAPEDVSGEPRRVAGGRLTVASSPLAVSRMGDAAEHAPASFTPPSPPPSPDARCMLCGKDYSFFRKRAHCTLCLRSACSSCLGHMDTEGPAQQEDVKALLRHAYLTAEQTVQLSTAAAAKTTLTSASGSAARPITFPSFSAEQVDHAFDKKSISTVPVCADCVRAVLWKLRYTQLWIPMSMFASVVEGDKHHREARRNSGVEAAHHDARDGANKNAVAGGDVDDGAGEPANPLSTVAHSQESSRQISAVGQSLPLSPERSAVPATAFDEVEHRQHDGRLPTGNSALCSAATADSSEASAVDEASHDLLAPTQACAAATEDKPSTPPAASPSSANDSAVAGTSPASALPPASASSQTPNLSGHPETVRHSCSKILPPTQYIIYSGYTSHTIPHVYGELWWGRQYYYRGGFCAGERHGFGTQYMPNGEWYEGGFERDAWHGEGVYYLEDGSVLLGEFRKGKLHAVHYRGEVEESDTCGVRPHGRGIGYSPDGSVYNGEWVHGQRHGTGMLHLADGSSVYSGTFVSDAMEGMGKLVTTSGAYYGDFSQNKQNGKGLLFTADCVVEGSWVQGTSSGFTRIYERVTGEVYETTYSDGNERDDCFTAPVMIDDDAAAECGQCGTAFSFFLRRHHCRLCGDVFCDACTQHRASLPSTVTGDGVPSAKSDPASSSASGVNGQQLRVCDACFFRLSQRRMIALRRYADGSVYAGCWSQGRWVSRGLYCRPDGVFVVMDTYGHALLPLAAIAKEPLKGGASADMKEPEKPSAAQPACGLGVVRRPSRATGLPVSSSVLQDAAPAKELLDGVSESSSRKDLDAFLLWWATTRSRCGLHVPLDVPLVIQYQRMPAQMLRSKEATVKAGSDAAAYLAAPARCTLETPHTPSLRPIRLFITLADSRREMRAMVEGEMVRTSASATPAETAAAPAPESRLSIEEKRTMDSDVEAAALRASRFMPVAIPRAPVVPITAATIPVTSAAELPEATTTAHPGSLHPAHQATGADPPHAFGFSAWATRPPPSIDPEDISDESLVEMMQAERLSWSAAAPAAKASAASTIPPLMPPTPAPPTPGLNTTVPWDLWTTRDVPRYAPPPPATEAAEATPAAQTLKEKASGGGEADAAPLPALRSEADMYFACPFWGPTVPDAQVLLEQGKMTQATRLMCRLQQQHGQAVNPQQQEKQRSDSGSSDGDGNGSGEGIGGRGATASGGGKTRRGSAADDPLSMLQSMQGGVPNASVSSWEPGHLFSSEQRAQCGDGWAPTPLRGPYVFDISAHEKHRSADGQRWYAKVTQREVLKF